MFRARGNWKGMRLEVRLQSSQNAYSSGGTACSLLTQSMVQSRWPLGTAHLSFWSNGQLIKCTYYPRSQHQREMSFVWWARRTEACFYSMNNICSFKHEDDKGRRWPDKAEKQTSRMFGLGRGGMMLISGGLSFVQRASCREAWPHSAPGL